MILEDNTIQKLIKWITAMLSIFCFKAYFLYIYTVIRNYTYHHKAYELSNHLGNVMVVVSDKRLGVDDGTGKASYYLADVTSATDYFPFAPSGAFSTNYKIKSGDTLGALALKFDTTVGAIANQNNISDVDKINAGNDLTITTGSSK